MSRLNPLRRKTPVVEKVNELLSEIIIPLKPHSNDLNKLHAEARSYGLVNTFSAADGCYSAHIVFPMPANTELKASSGYKHTTLAEALEAAIGHAKELKAMMK